jgi:hypothetical protein
MSLTGCFRSQVTCVHGASKAHRDDLRLSLERLAWVSLKNRRSSSSACWALSSQRWTGAAGSGGAWSQIVLYYSVLAPLRDPILNQVPTYWATHQVAALHEAIEGDADVQFANIAPAPTGSS